MKKTTLAITVVCLLLLYSCHNNSASSTAPAPGSAAVPSPPANVVQQNIIIIHDSATIYKGIDQFIYIKRPPGTTLKPIGVNIVSEDSLGCVIHPTEIGNVSIDVLENGTTLNTLATWHGIVKRIPDPSVILGGNVSGEMTKAELVMIRAVFLSSPFGRFTVNSFQLAVPVNGVWVTAASAGAAVTSQMLLLMASARSGNIIVFREIRCTGPDGQTRTLNGTSVKVR